MPINKLVSSKRAKALIASIAAVSIGGYAAIFASEKPVPDDVALAAKLFQPWEGRALTAYLDALPKKPVWTICDGDTDNVKPGMVETPAGCDKRLAIKLTRDYRAPLVRCIAGWDKRPLAWRAMMLSLAWNVGTGAACGSTAARLGIVGEYRASCEAATAFNKAGGRVVYGLVKRREMGDAARIGEAELCVSGL